MWRSSVVLLLIFLICSTSSSHLSRADVGTAASYRPPYLPTACFGNDSQQFPAGNLFVAAGEGIWDNGASCGRQYLVRCLSADIPGACRRPGQTIQVKVVDRASGLVRSKPSTPGTTMVLSFASFSMLAANPSTRDSINIEFAQV